MTAFRVPKRCEETISKAVRKDKFSKLMDANSFHSLSSPSIITRVHRCLPTALPALDVISAKDEDGVWGVPLGRQIEFSGKPDSGKTTMLTLIAAAAQRRGYKTAWIDTEHSLNHERAANLGVDLDKLYVSFPDYLEQAMESIFNIVSDMPKKGEKEYRKDEALVILFDSIAATPTQTEWEKLDQQNVALFAREMFKFQRAMNSRIAKRNVLVVYSNQLKEKIGVKFGKRTTTYGGNAVRYHAALRFECVYTGKLKTAGQVTGITMNINNEKNKCTTPYKQVEGIEFKFNGGFDFERSLLLALSQKGIAQKRGPMYTIFPYGKEYKKRGADFVKHLKDNPVECARFRKLLDEVL